MKNLQNLFLAITGKSQLQYLKLRAYYARHRQFRGDPIVSSILAHHGKTLEVLKLEQFHPTISLCEGLFHCPNLLKLVIALTHTLQVHHFILECG